MSASPHLFGWIFILCIDIPHNLTDNVATFAINIAFPAAIALTPWGGYVLNNFQLMKSLGGAPLTVVAGSGVPGFADGQGTAAMFDWSSGLVVHPVTGVIYITDWHNNRVRVCTPLGLISTLAGSAASGNTDGSSSIATFNSPCGIVMDTIQQYIYVTCFSANTLRQIVVNTGFTTTLAGSGAYTSLDGTGLLASFNNPAYVARGSSLKQCLYF